MKYHLAVVHEDAQIGENVTISPFATVEADVVIGDNCWIGPHAIVMSGTRIGKNCKIFPGAVVGSAPQDLKYKGEDTQLIVGDNVIIREYCTINRGTIANGKTVIGNNCLLMAYVHVAHDCVLGDHCILANNATLAGHVEVGDYAILNGMTAIHQFTKVGAHAMLGGGCLVNKDIPPYVRAARHPTAYIGVNSIGLRRRQFSEDTIRHLQEIYRQVFIKVKNTSQALEQLEQVIEPSPYREEIIDFIRSSKQGIIKSPRMISKD